jgi:hypothetical protein
MAWLLEVTVCLLLAQQDSGPKWRDRATYEFPTWWNAREATHALVVAAKSDTVALEKLSILDPQGEWRQFARALLAKEDFKGKIFAAALLARHGDFSGWTAAREEFLFRLACLQGEQILPTLWTFWNMTTAEDSQPGAAIRELQRMAEELLPADRDLVLKRIADFDPAGWMRQRR